MKEFWNSVVYQPLYNGLVGISNIIPTHDVGISIVILTVLVKVLLYPFTKKSTLAQEQMRSLEPEIRRVREKHKDNKEAQAKAMMELYQQRKVNPLGGCLPALIQLPIVIGLYFVFWKGLNGGSVDQSLLYSFVSAPEKLNLLFLGILDLSGKSLILALLAGVTQYIQLSRAKIGSSTSESPSATPQEDFARMFQKQIRYVLPVMVAFIAYTLSAAVALYFTVGNIVNILQETWIRRKKAVPTSSPTNV